MGNEAGEVEFAGDEKDDGADGAEPAVSASLALGGLEQTIDGFEKAVGLSGADPSQHALEMVEDHGGDVFHRLDLRTAHVRAPLLEQCPHDMGLLASEDLAQLLAVLPGSCRALGGHLGQQCVELASLCPSNSPAVL